MNRRIRALLLGTAFTASTVALGSAPAHAQTGTCTASKCIGKWPVGQTNCANDAYPVYGQTVTSPYGTVRLMYSPSCNANWAEADGVTGAPFLKAFNHYAWEDQWNGPISATWGYTTMVDGSGPAGVCITSTSQSLQWCTHQKGTLPQV